jgi:4'-phosphopantetheinyl transferase
VPGTDIRYSVSRSNELGLFAIARGTEVGVDVEAIGSEPDIDRVAALFFSEAERGALTALHYDERLRSSFQCWTCKEAYVKGTGRGLDDDVRSFETWSGTADPARVDDWFIHQVDVASGFAAALAIHRGANPVIEIQGAHIG